MERMKFRVSGEEQSKHLQEVLFKLGYKWWEHGNNFSFTSEPYIYTDGNRYVMFSGYGSKPFFESWSGQEYDTEGFIEKHAPQPEKTELKKTERQISVGELVDRFEKEPAKEKSDGGKTGYYDLVIKTKDGDFRCVVGDVIRAMVGNDFDLGNAIKAIRRIYADSQGFGKEGIDMQYDANKINYFVKEFVEFNSK